VAAATSCRHVQPISAQIARTVWRRDARAVAVSVVTARRHCSTNLPRRNTASEFHEELPKNETMSKIEDLYLSRARHNDDTGRTEMRGTFKPNPSSRYCYDYIFEPNDDGLATVVVPVFDQHGIIDVLAVGAYIWGCINGAGSYVGNLSPVLNLHRTPATWLASDSGVLPLARSFFPLARIADRIVARDSEHAEQIAQFAFITPALDFGLDVAVAERAAREKITF
jgi:hypothetical protein